jgi:hypothetical protein
VILLQLSAFGLLKMAATIGINQKHCAVIEFLVCEIRTAGNIQKRLQKMHGDNVDRSTVLISQGDFLGKLNVLISTPCNAETGYMQPLLREWKT